MAKSTMYVCEGYIAWRDEQMRLHREGGEPALLEANGEVGYYIHGKPHRTDGPAITRKDGSRIWFDMGIPFRAVMNGCEYTFVDGKPKKT